MIGTLRWYLGLPKVPNGTMEILLLTKESTTQVQEKEAWDRWSLCRAQAEETLGISSQMDWFHPNWAAGQSSWMLDELVLL